MLGRLIFDFLIFLLFGRGVAERGSEEILYDKKKRFARLLYFYIFSRRFIDTSLPPAPHVCPSILTLHSN